MAGQRRKPTAKGKKVSAAWQRRNQAAKAKGYASYYDYRIHDYGRIPASRPAIPKGRRQEIRGHGSGGRGFLARLGEGDLIMLSDLISSIETYVDSHGVERFRDYEKTVIPDIGERWTFTFRRQTREELRALIAAEQDKGATFTLAPSLDQRRLLRVGEE